MNIGILSDLHLGHSGKGRWHNRLLYDRASEIAQSAVAELNRQEIDWVIVLGDITNSGTKGQLALAREILSALSRPWYVVPGNHDRKAVRSGQFDEIFRENLPDFYSRQGDLGMLFLRERPPAEHTASPDMTLGTDCIDRAVRAVKQDRPSTLVLFSHVPLISEASFARAHRGKEAGHYEDGAELVARLEQWTQTPVIVLCGHQHWHHTMASQRWIQCTTGAMIEYPMEFRTVAITHTALQVAVRAGTSPEIAAASLDSAIWVRGRDYDRNGELVLLTAQMDRDTL